MASSGVLNTSGYNGRYLQFSWSIKNSLQNRIETNKTTISWTLTGAGDAMSAYYEAGNIKLEIEGATVYTRGKWDRFKLYSGTLVASGEHTFTHDSNGKRSFSVSLEAGIYLADVNCSGSGSFTIDDIPRSSTLTVSNGTLGTEMSLTINRPLSTFKHRLTYRCGDVAGYIAGTTEVYTLLTSFKWTPPIGLAAENTAGTSVTITLTLYTYTSDSVHVGTVTETITCAVPTSVKPSCSIRLDSDTSGVMNTYGKPVQNLSKLKLTVNATTSYGADITAYTLSANGTKYSDATVTTDVLTTAGSNKITATVKDTRGRSGSNSLTVDVLAYSAPVVSKLVVRRCDEDGTANDQGEYCQLVMSAVVTDLVGKNPPAYSVRYKQTTDDTYTEIPTDDLDGIYNVVDWSYIFPADGNASFDVEVTVEDNHGSHTRTTTLSTAFTLMNWGASGTGMGIGKVSEKDNTLEVGIDSDLQGEVFGRVYGLGALPAIPEGADLNAYLTPGVYAVRTTEVAATIKNKPVSLAGRLIVSSASGQAIADESVYRYIEQRFIPYSYGIPELDRPAYLRYVVQEGAESYTYREWFNEALKAYPVGSIHLRYDHTNPGDIFGGTWARISSYILRGAAEGGTIGETGTIADGSGRTYINISIWRRTA